MSAAVAAAVAELAESPSQQLQRLAQEAGLELHSPEFAAFLDQQDPLSAFRDEFCWPKAPEAPEKPCIYLCGNSLGLMPKRTRKYVDEELDKWGDMGVEGHFLGARPWARIDEFVTPMTAELVGAQSADEVAIMNSLSVNLHLLLSAFYRPKPGDRRRKLLMEANAFCSDHHVVRSQISALGLELEDCLVLLEPAAGEEFVSTERTLQVIEELGDELALIMLGGLQYMTGQLFDMKTITEAGHKQGALVAFDLAHAVGNVPLQLHAWGVDWAAWCSYKYLNSGPGSIAGIFVHNRHARRSQEELPRLRGWWGQQLEDRFRMDSEHQGKPGAQSFQISNPAVLPTVCLFGALEVHTEAGMPRLRAKSLLLTGLLQLLLNRLQAEHSADPAGSFWGWKQLTPTDPEQRGAQISLRMECPVDHIVKRLATEGVILDARRPNIIRISPAPLYNRFAEVHRFVELLADCLRKDHPAAPQKKEE